MLYTQEWNNGGFDVYVYRRMDLEANETTHHLRPSRIVLSAQAALPRSGASVLL